MHILWAVGAIEGLWSCQGCDMSKKTQRFTRDMDAHRVDAAHLERDAADLDDIDRVVVALQSTILNTQVLLWAVPGLGAHFEA